MCNNFPPDIGNNISQRVMGILPQEALSLLRKGATISAGYGWSLYLEGGYVRDCLLQIPDYDIDLSVVGDAPQLALEMVEGTSAALETHPSFGTATLTLQDSRFHIDIVTARREWYERPGALPTVEPGTIQEDLARRDFTVNAMAVRIEPDGFGPFLDPHHGVADLRSGLIRVLHAQSFRDDPTRIFRAVKLTRRLGFKIERDTLELILQAVRDGVLATISIERITHELLLIMEEPRAGDILAELDKLGVLGAIHPALSWPYAGGTMGPGEEEPLSKGARRDTYLAIIAAEFARAPEDAEALARLLRLNTEQIRLMRDSARLAAIWPQLGDEDRRPHEIYRLLHRLDHATLQAYTHIGALAKDELAWTRLNDYLDRLSTVKPELSGHYLREHGVPPGPAYRHLLDDLQNAKLDGELPDRDAEEKFVREWLARH